MSIKKKILISAISLIVLCAAVLGGLKLHTNIQVKRYSTEVFPIKKNVSELPTNESTFCYAFDISDTRKMVACLEYVFVARIDEQVGVSYSDVSANEFGKITGTPFTNFKITVLKNIKGDLKTDVPIDFKKYGGPDIGEKTLCTVAEDPMPEVGGVYLILATVNEKDELFTSGSCTCFEIQSPAANAALKSSGKKLDLNNDSTVKLYIDAYKHQDTSVKSGVDLVCKDSVSYKAGVNDTVNS